MKDAPHTWHSRLSKKLAITASGGLVAGGLLSVLHSAPLGRYAAGTAASWCIFVGTFGVLQESIRAARGVDSMMNSSLAGAATGGLLLGLHLGRPSALPGAAIGCGVASGCHWVGDQIKPGQSFRDMLIEWDLLDPLPGELEERARQEQLQAAQAAARAASGGSSSTGGSSSGSSGTGTGGWRDWMPFRRMSDEEWEEHQRKTKEKFRERVAVTKEGGLPALVNKSADADGGDQKP